MKTWLIEKQEPSSSFKLLAKTYDDAWADAEQYMGITVAVTYCDEMYCSECLCVNCKDNPDYEV